MNTNFCHIQPLKTVGPSIPASQVRLFDGH
jgi:hypothetical protein